MGLTVEKLKKALRGLPSKMPVYIADHDHDETETNGVAHCAYVVRQKGWKDSESQDSPQIDVDYFVIRG